MAFVFDAPEKRTDPDYLAKASPRMEIVDGLVYRCPRQEGDKPAYRLTGEDWCDCEDGQPVFRTSGDLVYLYDDWSAPVFFVR